MAASMGEAHFFEESMNTTKVRHQDVVAGLAPELRYCSSADDRAWVYAVCE